MRRQSNPIMPHEKCLQLCVFGGLYFDFVLSPVFKYKALAGVLSSSIWVLYQGRIFLAATQRKKKKTTLQTWFVLSARTTKFFLMFSFMAYTNLETSPKRLETELTNIARPQFCSLPVLNIPLFTLFTFSYRNFFPLFVCFDILWQLATTHARTHATRTSSG